MMHSAELIVDARNSVGESPVWHAADKALYWVDITQKKLYQWSATSATVRAWTSPEMIGCIAMHSAGGFIAGMESGIFQLRLPTSGQGDALHATRLVAAPHSAPGMRFNDGRCDRQGRLVAGTMMINMAVGHGNPCVTSYANNSELRLLVAGMVVPNGLAFSPDGCTMYLSDSHPSVQTVWAFDYDTATGTPSNRRVFVDMNPLPGRPDGAAVDADGCYWICANDAGLVHRFTPLGKLDLSLTVPVKKPAMCAFGGDDMRTLFVTSIRPDGIDLSDQPLAGAVFALRPGVQGLPEPVFAAQGR
jgi:sugar lactone lactonase YvrE